MLTRYCTLTCDLIKNYELRMKHICSNTEEPQTLYHQRMLLMNHQATFYYFISKNKTKQFEYFSHLCK